MEEIYPYYRFAVGILRKYDSVDRLLEELDLHFLPPPLERSHLEYWMEKSKDDKYVRSLKIRDLLRGSRKFKRVSKLRKDAGLVADMAALSARFDPEQTSSRILYLTETLYNSEICNLYIHYFLDKDTLSNPLKCQKYLEVLRARDLPAMEYFLTMIGQDDVAMFYHGLSGQFDAKQILDTIAATSYVKFLEVVKYGRLGDAKIASFWANNAIMAVKAKQSITIGKGELEKLLSRVRLTTNEPKELPTRENLDGEVIDVTTKS